MMRLRFNDLQELLGECRKVFQNEDFFTEDIVSELRLFELFDHEFLDTEDHNVEFTSDAHPEILSVLEFLESIAFFVLRIVVEVVFFHVVFFLFFRLECCVGEASALKAAQWERCYVLGFQLLAAIGGDDSVAGAFVGELR